MLPVCYLLKVAAVQLCGSMQGEGPTVGHEDGGGGGARDLGDHHHPDRGRQRHRAGAVQIVPTTFRW